MAKLIFRYGSMNSAKSADLIMQAYRLRADGKKVQIFKPALDTRDGAFVRSRAVPTELKANLVQADDVGFIFSEVVKYKPRIVLVDEVQFLTVEQVEELASVVDVQGITVIAYGLLTDFRGLMFAGSKRLAELADNIERLRSECVQCNNEGVVNARFINGQVQRDGEQIVVGAEEKYKVLCRKCYFDHLNGV